MKGFSNNVVNTSLFILTNIETLFLILVYVDDFIITGSNDIYIATLISKLNIEFSLKELGDVHFILGIEVKRDHNNMLLT